MVDLRGELPIRLGVRKYRQRTQKQMQDVKWFVVHHTNPGPSRPSAMAVARYQIGPTAQAPFPEAAYHFYIAADGTIYVFHDIEKLVWANGIGSPEEQDGVGIYNWWTIAACFAGDNPTEQQLASLSHLIAGVRRMVGRNLEILGHRQVSKDACGHALTECPGNKMDSWLLGLQSKSEAL